MSWKCWFLRRKENRSTRRKTLGARTRTNNKLNPQMNARSGNRTRVTWVGGERPHHCAIPAPHSCSSPPPPFMLPHLPTLCTSAWLPLPFVRTGKEDTAIISPAIATSMENLPHVNLCSLHSLTNSIHRSLGILPDLLNILLTSNLP